MAKLDAYLRSIERFGAAGAVLVSGQAVTLKFPTGDRHATQVTPHDLLVGIVREVAPPAVLDQVDKNRPAQFEYESNGFRYAINVAPRQGAWQVAIAVATAQTAPARPPPSAPAAPVAPLAAPTGDMAIERGQYDAPGAAVRATTSGSGLLDELTRAARAARATDVYLAANATPVQRVGGELVAAAGQALDGESLSREIGVVAPGGARAAWTEGGAGVFAYSDGGGRVRASLARDQRGPIVALRLLPDEPPPLESLGLRLDDWLGRGGLVVIAGASGAGKTVTLAAIVRALAERKRRAISIEDPIELVHASPWISQRAVGAHVESIAAGVASAMREGADAIAVGATTTSEAAAAIIDAVAGGHFVVTTIAAPIGASLERLLELVPPERRDSARAIVGGALLGTLAPVVARGARTFEIARPDV